MGDNHQQADGVGGQIAFAGSILVAIVFGILFMVLSREWVKLAFSEGPFSFIAWTILMILLGAAACSVVLLSIYNQKLEDDRIERIAKETAEEVVENTSNVVLI